MADRRWSRMAGMLVVLAITYSPAAGEDIGQIKTLTGEVYLVRQNVKRPAQVGDRLEAADTIITGPNSSVGITFIDNSRFSAGPRATSNWSNSSLTRRPMTVRSPPRCSMARCPSSQAISPNAPRTP